MCIRVEKGVDNRDPCFACACVFSLSTTKMFKVSLLLCVVATFATEAPVISLDLSHTKGLVKNGEV